MVRARMDDRCGKGFLTPHQAPRGNSKMNRKEHWESIYRSKSDEQLSWTQPEPLLSLKLIGEACSSGRVIDIGGGTSVLAERLMDRGYTVTVLDISETALEHNRKRLGARASRI